MARIAYDILDNDTITKANSMLETLAPYTTLENKYPFVECATFADEIKQKGWNDQAGWHFVDNPFFDNYTNTLVYPEVYNITWAINEMTNSLKGCCKEVVTTDSKSEKGKVSWELSDSFNLRLLIHYVGDIH